MIHPSFLQRPSHDEYRIIPADDQQVQDAIREEAEEREEYLLDKQSNRVTYYFVIAIMLAGTIYYIVQWSRGIPLLF